MGYGAKQQQVTTLSFLGDGKGSRGYPECGFLLSGEVNRLGAENAFHPTVFSTSDSLHLQVNKDQAWWLTPVILELKRLRQGDCHEYEVTLGYRMRLLLANFLKKEKIGNSRKGKVDRTLWGGLDAAEGSAHLSEWTKGSRHGWSRGSVRRDRRQGR